MKKLLIVASEFPPMKAGVASLASSVHHEFLTHNEDVYSFVPVGSQITEPLKEFPLYLRDKKGPGWWWNIKNSFILRKLILGNNIDTLLILDASARCLPFFWVPRIKTAVYVNGTELFKGSFWGEALNLRFFLHRRALHRADKIICISKATRQALERNVSHPRVEVVYPSYGAVRVYNSTDGQSPYPRTEDKLIFLTVARVTHRKGHDTVLKILAELKDKLPPFHYYIVGRGDFKPALTRLSRELNIEDQVSFLEGVEDGDLGGHYHFADFFIMLSRKSKEGVEGFGLTYIEASASGTLCIGSSHGGAAEAVKQDVSGIKVSETDIEAASRDILKLVNDKDKCRALSESGKKWARENYSGEIMYQNMKKALEF